MRNYFTHTAFVAVFFNLFVQNTVAFEVEHEAHEHGHATLTLVQENSELQLVFKSPAVNIVGFEHQPSSKEQHEKIDQAKATLNNAEKLFVLSESAGCELEHVHIASSLLEDKNHDKHDERDDHDDHHAHEGEEVHSEFEAEYHFKCKNIKALKEVKVALLSEFKSLEEVEAQIIANGSQRLVELNQNSMKLEF